MLTGPPPSSLLKEARTELLQSIRNSKQTKLKSANIDDKSQRSFNGYTALHIAAMFGRLDVCKFIMENIDDKSPRCNGGSTPLHVAASYGHLEICKYFLENINDKNPRNDEGWTPLHVRL